jgi:catechol 2,3-dioxygenase-like lactoylglutathione lyase family enzyme
VKIHFNLATNDLAASLRFYTALLDSQPAKVRDDYALFITEEPGLELALDLTSGVQIGADAHYGIFVESTEEVDAAIARLEGINAVSSVEREETCCYANQTKVWATDPDARRWEVYTVHSDTEEKNDEDTTCCTTPSGERSCCAA